MSQAPPAIIIDNGSAYTKFGYSGDDAPHYLIPTVVGTPKVKSPLVPREHYIVPREHYIGDDAITKRALLSMKYPYEYGIITHFDEYELLLHHIFFSQLRLDDLSSRQVVLTESIFNPQIHREKLSQIMFETFDINSLYFGIQPALAVVSTGRSSGIVLDIGSGTTTIVPIRMGLPIQHAIVKVGYAGRDLDHYLEKLLQQNGFSMTGSATTPIIKDIKETMCYVARDYNLEVEKYNLDTDGILSQKYELPDGNTITLGKELFQCPEVLFQPNLMDLEMWNIQQCFHNSIMKCDIDIRAKLYQNIVLSGCTTKFKNFNKRLLSELKQLGHPDIVSDARIVSQSDTARDAAFIGASLITSHETFTEDYIITKDEYNEYGPSCCDRKRNNISKFFPFDDFNR